MHIDDGGSEDQEQAWTAMPQHTMSYNNVRLIVRGDMASRNCACRNTLIKCTSLWLRRRSVSGESADAIVILGGGCWVTNVDSLQRPIGHGGQGDIWFGEYNNTQVAIKVFAMVGPAGESDGSIEIRAYNRLGSVPASQHCPHLLRVFPAVICNPNESVWLPMELADEDWLELIDAEGAMPEVDVRRIWVQMIIGAYRRGALVFPLAAKVDSFFFARIRRTSFDSAKALHPSSMCLCECM